MINFKNTEFMKWTVKNSPKILTAFGVTGMITTVVLAVKATPKAMKAIDEEKVKKNVDELSTTEIIKVSWKSYVPAAVTGAFSIVCAIGSTHISAKRNAALLTALGVSKEAALLASEAHSKTANAFDKYKEAVKENVDEETEKKISKNYAEKTVENQPVIVNDGRDKTLPSFVYGNETLFYDDLTGRYFISTPEHIRKIINDINKEALEAMDNIVCSSEFYERLGLGATALSDELFWEMYNYEDMLEVDLSEAVVTQDKKTSAIVMRLNHTPHFLR